MKLKHLGYYQADYPTLGLTGVAPGAEVEITSPDRARAVLVEGIFAPGDGESLELLVAAQVAAAKAHEQDQAVTAEPVPDFTEALAEAQQAREAALAAAAALVAEEQAEPQTTKAGKAGKAGA